MLTAQVTILSKDEHIKNHILRGLGIFSEIIDVCFAGELLGRQVTPWLYGYNFQCVIMDRKPASTSQGHMITILIQSVFFSVRSSELNGAGPAVPTSCGNWPSDRYAVIHDCERVRTHVYFFFAYAELIYAWNDFFFVCGFVFESRSPSWWLMAVCSAVSLDSRLELFLSLCPSSLLMI